MAEQSKQTKMCYFCVNGLGNIDYKDTETLQNFINIYKKILPRKRTGVCSWHQRKLARAIKQARIMALLPFIRK